MQDLSPEEVMDGIKEARQFADNSRDALAFVLNNTTSHFIAEEADDLEEVDYKLSAAIDGMDKVLKSLNVVL